MPELQFLKTLIFGRVNRVTFSRFSYLKFFSAFILNGSTTLFSKLGKIKDGNVEMDTRVNIYVKNDVYC